MVLYKNIISDNLKLKLGLMFNRVRHLSFIYIYIVLSILNYKILN